MLLDDFPAEFSFHEGGVKFLIFGNNKPFPIRSNT